jgi:hypothetical protein
MKIDRLQILWNDPTLPLPSSNVEESGKNLDTLYIDIKNDDLSFVNVYGGEYSTDCECCGNIDISYYGIQLDDISIELSAKTALELCKKLKEHLETNGHKI